LKGFEIKTRSRSERAAVLTMKLIYRERGPLRVMTYDFIREDGRWRIDNFRGRGWTVREILTLWLKGP
jgi:hypothetical protein